jgi:hypothetical protein
VYSRAINQDTLTFEASGGLLNAGLVMLDRETRSYWSIMTEDAIWGEHKGQPLSVLPGARKMTFGQWHKLHPQTRVLSVEGTVHSPTNSYDRYFSTSGGFRGLRANDRRLQDKALLYGLHVEGEPWIIAHDQFDGGDVATIGARRLFLFRLETDSPFQGTTAWWLEADDVVEKRDGGWVLVRQDVEHPFSVSTRTFAASPGLVQATGFDTYWYIWSLTNPETQIADVGR